MYDEFARPLKILIADDSNSDRLLLRAIIQNQGHTPLMAADGMEAITIFNKDKPDIILLDAMMPRMDGFDTARYIKSRSADHFVPIIFLTSLNEADSLARCLEAGGDDFLTKPYNNIILKAKINAFRRMLKMHVTLQQQRDQIAAHNERLVREQEVAKLTFDKVAHEGSLNAPNIQYRLSSMAIFNGDVLLAAMRPNGNLCVLLGDFTGHGLAAAIGAMPLSQTFYSMVAKGFSIRDMASEINRKLKEILPVSVFCCAVMVDMDFRGKQVEIWSGGMPDSFLFRAATGDVLPISSNHMALGILPPERFSAKTAFHAMENNDRLYLWSDGIIEAENQFGEMFGEERLKNIFTHNPQPEQLFGAINQTLDQFIDNTQRSDDISIAEIAMVDIAEMAQLLATPSKINEQLPSDWSLSFEVRAASLRNSDPLPVLQKFLAELPGLRPRSGELFTVLSELFSNALEHGVLGLHSEMKASQQGFSHYYYERFQRLQVLRKGFVRFDLHYRATTEANTLELVVSDSGEGFDIQSLVTKIPDAAELSGRGIHLIQSICNQVEYLGNGSQVKVVFEW